MAGHRQLLLKTLAVALWQQLDGMAGERAQVRPLDGTLPARSQQDEVVRMQLYRVLVEITEQAWLSQ